MAKPKKKKLSTKEIVEKLVQIDPAAQERAAKALREVYGDPENWNDLFTRGLRRHWRDIDAEPWAREFEPRTAQEVTPFRYLKKARRWTNTKLLSTSWSTKWSIWERARCAENPIYFACTYCRSINFRNETQGAAPIVEPLPQWPHVIASIKAFYPARDIVIEKSRQMSLSWIAAAVALHDILFRGTWAVMMLSRVESLVDDGGENSTVDSLMGKVRFLYDMLPPFLQMDPLEIKYLSIRNPRLRSHIKGFSATPSAGRGATWGRAIADEFAWVPHSEQVMMSMDRACPIGKALVSTPNGRANAFARIRDIARPVWPLDQPELTSREKEALAKRGARAWERFTVHWSQHPLRDEAWYQEQKQSGALTELAVAQELDISYAKSLGRRVYPRFVWEQHVAGGSLCDVSTVGYVPERALLLTCDFNYDPLIWVLAQAHSQPPRYRVFGEIARRNAVIDDALREFIFRFGKRDRIRWFIQRYPEWEEDYGRNGICTAGENGHQLPVYIYGDATEEKSTVRDRRKAYTYMRQELKEAGFDVHLRVPKANPPKRQRIDVLNNAIEFGHLVVAPHAEELLKDFESGVWDAQQQDMNQRVEDDDGSGLTRSHATSALGYMIHVLHKVGMADATVRTRSRRPEELLPEYIRGW
jgi:hypothetical protein